MEMDLWKEKFQIFGGKSIDPAWPYEKIWTLNWRSRFLVLFG